MMMKHNIITVAVYLLGLIAVAVNALAPLPPKAAAKGICRKGFLIGAGAAIGTGAAVIGTTGAALAISSGSNPSDPYQPPQDSMTGKVVVVTGGSTGLGLESAKRLAAAGATIVLTSRTSVKGEKAVEAVKEHLSKKGITDTSSPSIYNLVLDLDDLENVKAFPKAYKDLGIGSIDILMNNAGVMAIQDLQLTKDGYERTFQSNHLGHFVLTAGLFPYLSREKSTIINVSSEAFQFVREMDIDNLNAEKEFGPWSSYGLSKLANILFTQELQRRADKAGDSWLTAVTLHPGAVATDLGRYLVGEEKWNELKTKGPSGLESLALNAASVFTKTVPEGASTQIYLAAGADGAMKKAAFYENMKPKQSLPAYATDETKAKQLWEKSEEYGGITFDITPIEAETQTSSSS